MALSGHSNTVIRCLLLGGKSDILAPERHSGSVGRELPFHVQAVAPCYVFLAAFVPCYVFLANDEASYISGQVLHPNGGNVIGS
jgi:hypothetical protein